MALSLPEGDRRKIKKKVYDDPELGVLNRGSYMSAHVLLNLLNELGKRAEHFISFSQRV